MLTKTTVEQARANLANAEHRMALEAKRVLAATRRHEAAQRDVIDCTARYNKVLFETQEGRGE